MNKITDKNENLRSKIVHQMHSLRRFKFERRKYILKGRSDIAQLDIAQLDSLKKYNNNFAYFLLLINCFTRQIYVKELKTKQQQEVLDAARNLFKKAKKKFQIIMCDRGSEFNNKKFKDFCKNELKTKLFFSYSTVKCAFAERYIGILKRKIFISMNLRNSHNWVSVLQKIAQEMNNNKHSRFHLTPNEIDTPEGEKILLKHYNNLKQRLVKKTKFKIGDYVRFAYNRKVFDRLFNTYFTPEIYQIKAISLKYPEVYLIVDYNGKIVDRKFYASELRKTQPIYFIEKIIKTRKDGKALVKWQNYSNEYNSWVNLDQIYGTDDEEE